MQVGITLRSWPRWLNEGRIRMVIESFRRNGPDYSLIDGLPVLIPAVDEVHDRDRAESMRYRRARANIESLA